MKTITSVLLSITGVIIGIFIGRQFFPICPKIDPKPKNFVTINEDDAHKKSINFRKAKGYCDDPDAHKTDGFFVLTPTFFEDMLTSKKEIENACVNAGIAVPSNYRCIFGTDDGVSDYSKMMIVGLDVSGEELKDDGCTQILNEKLKCPIFCDEPYSQIIFGIDGKQGCQ